MAEGRVEGVTLSLVVPCYNEEACVETFVREVDKTGLESVEILFVDDGSSDKTLEVVKRLHEQDKRVGYVSFSRNFGKEAALLAGLRKASGKFVATMDVDLQDPPALLPEMLHALEHEGFDSVATRRSTREGEPVLRSWFARRFYELMGRFSEVALVDGARDFRMMRREVVEAVLALPEVNRFTKGIYQWVGFRTKWLEFPNVERVAGQTKWSFWKLFVYALQGITAFSTAPLLVASWLGLLCCVSAFVSFMYILVRVLLFGDAVSGWPSMVCTVIFFGGLQLFVIGILGVYIAKLYLETKHRPVYIVREESKGGGAN